MQNATIYTASTTPLSKSDISRLKEVKNVRTDGGMFKQATHFDVELSDRVLRINVMASSETEDHFQGFKGYVHHLHEVEPLDNLDEVIGYIDCLKQAYGLETDKRFDFDSEVFSVLNALADSLSGVIFVCDSLIDTEGMVIFGPLGSED